MKNFFLILFAVIAIGSGIAFYYAQESNSTAQKGLNEERYKRMTAEESLHNLLIKIKTLETELEARETAILEEAERAMSLEKQLEQELQMNASLKSQLSATRQRVVRDSLDKHRR